MTIVFLGSKIWISSQNQIPFIISVDTNDPNHVMGIKRGTTVKFGGNLYCKTCRLANNNREVERFPLPRDTWVKDSRIPVLKALELALTFVCRMPVSTAFQQIEVNISTAVEWYSFFRTICGRNAFQQNVGGPLYIVEVNIYGK